jgi:hypothetical protein
MSVRLHHLGGLDNGNTVNTEYNSICIGSKVLPSLNSFLLVVNLSLLTSKYYMTLQGHDGMTCGPM